MARYEVIESKVWVGPNGITASPYGSCPWTSEADKPNWQLKTVGWTVRNLITGTVGIGKLPFDSKKEAQDWVDCH